MNPIHEQPHRAAHQSSAEFAHARLGFIGVGSFISHTHLPSAAAGKFSRVRALCDIDEHLLAERAGAYQPTYTTTDYRTMLSDPEVDIVVIGTKQDAHTRLACEALRAGKWVLVEKPVGETLDDFREILRVSREAQGRVAVGHNRRFAPAVLDGKPLLDSQTGPRFLTHRVSNPALGKAFNYYASRSSLLYEGCHMLDLANFLVGAYPSRVYCSGEPLRRNMTVVEYPDGSRFSLLMEDRGSPYLEKEYMEWFRGHVSITVKDYMDMRVRGVPGEFDRIYLHHHPRVRALVEQHGADLLEVLNMELHMRLLQNGPLQRQEGWHRLPAEHVRRPGPIFDVDAILKSAGFSDPAESGTSGKIYADKGWKQSLDHFCRCFLDNTEPQNANVVDAIMACVTANAALESLETGKPVPVVLPE